MARSRVSAIESVAAASVGADPFGDDVGSPQIAEFEPGARHLVGVGRPDAAPRRAERVIAARRLGGAVGRDVIGQHDVRAVRDLDARDVDADAGKHVQFVDQPAQADDRPAADEQQRPRLQHRARYDPQREFARADDDRVACVVAAAEARHDVVVGAVVVDDAALALVAPLDADDDVGLPVTDAGYDALHRVYSPRNSRSSVGADGRGGAPLNSVITYSLKSALGQPKSLRENFSGSLGSNDSWSR